MLSRFHRCNVSRGDNQQGNPMGEIPLAVFGFLTVTTCMNQPRRSLATHGPVGWSAASDGKRGKRAQFSGPHGSRNSGAHGSEAVHVLDYVLNG